MLNGLGFDEMFLLSVLGLLFIKPQQLGQMLRWIRTTRGKLANFRFDLEEKVDQFVHENLDPTANPKAKITPASQLTNKAENKENMPKVAQEMSHNKHYYRKTARYKLNTLDREEQEDDSQEIIKKIARLESWRQATKIALYRSIKEEPLLNELGALALQDGKEVYYPWLDSESDHIGLAQVSNFEDDLEIGAFDIEEPCKELQKSSNPEEIELFLVPGIAFGESGERLGRGKGFYDKLLNSYPEAFKIGVSFDFQVFKEPIPQQNHDIRMDMLITPQRLLKFGKKA